MLAYHCLHKAWKNRDKHELSGLTMIVLSGKCLTLHSIHFGNSAELNLFRNSLNTHKILIFRGFAETLFRQGGFYVKT